MRQRIGSGFRAIAIAASIVFAAPTAWAGTDADGVPDAVDNCPLTPNGPAQLSNQVDTDADGFGNACDADYDGNGLVTTADYLLILNAIVAGEGPLFGPDLVLDHDGDGYFTLADIAIFEQMVRGARLLGQ
ncbi:MAG: thrombospondin type 3 repeat-containing protein [Myxococcota bacterium]